MRVIPVVDVMHGRAVRARGGDRGAYAPLVSPLSAIAGDALALARAYRERLGLTELYVADLDAIMGSGSNARLVAALAQDAEALVDAGVTDDAAASELLSLGAQSVVVGSETLPTIAHLEAILRVVPAARVVFSLDVRGPSTLGTSGLPAKQLVREVRELGVRTVIVLDLSRVGESTGGPAELVGQLHEEWPDLDLIAGGGIRDMRDVQALATVGACAALAGTALHTGAIDRSSLQSLT